MAQLEIQFDATQLAADLHGEAELLTGRQRTAIGRGAVDTLRRSPPGLLPAGWYLTGRQRRGYGWRPVAPERIVITNRAANPRDGTFYPAINERRYHVTERALTLRRRRWIQNVRRHLDG